MGGATGRGGAGGSTGGAAGRGGAGGSTGAAGRGGTGGSAGTGGSTGTGGTGGGMGCVKPAAPPNTSGPADYTNGGHGNYGTPTNGSTDDAATHQTVSKLHMEVLRAAYLCDIIRCGTFQFSPGTNHVGFKGFYPGDNNGIYQHHPVSHAVGSGVPNSGTTPDALTVPQIRFLFNIQNWYFARHAENLKLWKDSIDGFGNSLLDSTVVPFVSEVADYTHNRNGMAALIIGGKKLGMQVGQYKTGTYTINNFWGTVAQPFGYTTTGGPIAAPIAGLWVKPA
jgi:hypothetical protein